MKTFRSLLIAAAAIFAGIFPAAAQQFSNVPAQSVIGRIGIPGDTGPSQAIPFPNLIAQLNVLSRNGDYGNFVKCFGVDDTITIQTALTAGGAVHLPVGTCKITSTLTISQNFTTLSCVAPELTTITANFASTPMISVSDGIVSPIIENCGLTRSVTATSGGSGINFVGSASTPIVRHNEVSSQYVGAVLRVTGYGQHYGNFYHTNVVDGVEEINTATSGSLQWYSSGNLYQTNGSRGHAIIAVGGPTQVTVGSQTNDNTFANSGAGLAFFGLVGTPIQGVRVLGGFYGQDGNSEVYLDTYGGQHHIQGVFTELAGTGLTGPTLTTPASGVGSGIEVTANNLDVTITSPIANSNSQNGIKSSATSVTNITGLRAAGNTGKGVLLADGTKVTLTSSTFASNTGGDVSVTANSSSLIACGNFPGSINSDICIPGAALTKTDDTNVTLTLGGSPTTALVNAASMTLGWTGTLAAGRLNSNVVQAITNDTNVTGSISAQTLTLGWTGTLAVARGGTGGGAASGTLLDNITGFASTGFLRRTGAGAYSFDAAGQMLATATNDNASSGNVGEYIQSNVPSGSATVTISNASPAVITETGHGLTAANNNCSAINFTTTGSLPTGLSTATTYYVTVVDTNTYKVSTTVANCIAGTFVNTSSAGSGTQTAVHNATLATATALDVTGISLTAGDWEVDANCQFTGGATTTVLYQICSISQSANTLDATVGRQVGIVYNSVAIYNLISGTTVSQVIPPLRFSLSGTTTLHLVVQESFGTSTANTFGIFRARRVR